jgi:hypothetical protein
MTGFETFCVQRLKPFPLAEADFCHGLLAGRVKAARPGGLPAHIPVSGA